MITKLRGRIRINACGRNISHFINKLHSERIVCLGQYCKKDVFHADIFKRDLKKVQNIADELNIELKTAEYKTAASEFSGYKKRVGFFIGIIAVLLCTLYFSQVIVTIEIQGNSAISDEVILSALSELDIKRGTFIRKLDLRLCEDKLRLMIDDVLSAHIRHTGNRIVVEVTEFDKKPEMLLKRVPCNIVSCKDAVITSVSVCDGQLMHIIGDHVTEGTVLISGMITDSKGHLTMHHALGGIKGIYVDSAVFRCEYSPERYEPTGKSKSKHYLKLFSLDIPLSVGDCKFSTYQKQTVEKPLSIFGMTLPIAVRTEEINEMKLSEVKYTDEELEKQLMEKIYLYEKNFLPDVRIISRKIKKNKSDTALTYQVSYCLEGEIGRQSDIFVND